MSESAVLDSETKDLLQRMLEAWSQDDRNILDGLAAAASPNTLEQTIHTLCIVALHAAAGEWSQRAQSIRDLSR